MVALVLAGPLAEVCGWTVCSGGPFIHTRDCGGIVAAGAYGALANVQVLADHIEVDQSGELFQVAVGDGAVGL